MERMAERSRNVGKSSSFTLGSEVVVPDRLLIGEGFCRPSSPRPLDSIISLRMNVLPDNG